MAPTLVVATGNPHKRAEIGALLAPFGVHVVTARERGLGDVPETGDTFEANALLKAEAAWEHTREPCLADDSGLEVEALGGEPGVYSARFAGPDATDRDNNAKLIRLLAEVPASERGARFVCALALVLPAELAGRAGDGPWQARPLDGASGAVAITVRGACPGRIIDDARGDAGFGYDPHFLYEPLGRTFAQLTSAEKHEVSHRGRAMKALGELFARVFAEHL